MDVPGRIDHTVLGPETTAADVRTLLEEAHQYGTNACLPPCFAELAAEDAPGTTIATVVGFPHGQHTTATKVAEATEAREAGVDEIDLVANAGLLKAGEDDAYQKDVAEVVAAVPLPVKVIVQAPRLTDAETRRACELAGAADADFVKTATGFGPGGATTADVSLMAEYLPVKASGGIGSWADAEAMFDAGADRIGASSGATIVQEWQDATGSDGTGGE